MKYKFSVIIAVNSTCRFLSEAIESVIAQSIGFQNIQLILVAACSHEGVGAVCDEYAAAYPENILLRRINTKDQNSARNLGLDHAKGMYVNFLEADDLLSADTLQQVWDFYEAHPNETDLVSVPIRFFEGLTGEQTLNTKFAQGSRVIDLEQEWQVTQIAMSSAFVPLACLKELRFAECLGNAAEAYLAQRLLAQRLRIGVAAQAEYRYRKVIEGSRSAIFMKAKNSIRYLSYVQEYPEKLISFCLERYGCVPRSVQYGLLHHMQWRWSERNYPRSAMTPEEAVTYMQRMSAVLRYIDDDLIQDLRDFTLMQKNVILQRKYEDAPQLPYWLDFARWQGDTLVMEGRIVPITEHMEELELELRVNGKAIACQLQPCHRWIKMLAGPAAGYVAFRVEVPRPAAGEILDMEFSVSIGSRAAELVSFGYGKFFPVGRKYRNGYWVSNRCVLTCTEGGLRLRRIRFGEKLLLEYRYLKEIWDTNAHSDRKAISVRLAHLFLKPLKLRPLWLISDRVAKAGDNGEALFRYLREKEPRIDARFVLSRSSPDYERMGRLGKVVEFRSQKHNVLAPLADAVISSHMEENIYRPYEGLGEPYRDLYADVKFIFLQHGITKDDISTLISRYKKNFSGVVAAAMPEYQAFQEGGYGYHEDQVLLTGFPRFDRLYRDERRKIVIMPTWRRYLMDSVEEQTGEWTVSAGFAGSEYVRFYSELLSSEKLLQAARRLGYTLAFLPHPSVQAHLEHFTIAPEVEVLGAQTEYRDVFAQSDLLVTDYSSVVFDFAYLRKPVIYTHFDASSFFGGNHTYTKGYFDYERDGFGEVETDLEGTVERIISYMEEGCVLKEGYRQRIDAFFAFDDRENCRRVTQAILERTGKKKGQ